MVSDGSCWISHESKQARRFEWNPTAVGVQCRDRYRLYRKWIGEYPNSSVSDWSFSGCSPGFWPAPSNRSNANMQCSTCRRRPDYTAWSDGRAYCSGCVRNWERGQQQQARSHRPQGASVNDCYPQWFGLNLADHVQLLFIDRSQCRNPHGLRKRTRTSGRGMLKPGTSKTKENSFRSDSLCCNMRYPFKVMVDPLQ